MRGEGLEAPITWTQIRDYCLEIEQQLAEPLSSLAATRRAAQVTKRQTLGIVTLATALILIGIIGIVVKKRSLVPFAPSRASLPDAVTVAAGKHPVPDGTEETLPAFRISANEVTIGQYAEFLETLATLAKDGREHTFDFTGQAPEKTSHQPDDWPALSAAAKANDLWNKQSVSLDSPVIGVDWWDAAAYAEWKKARLPSQEEWFAALNLEVKSPAMIEPGPWAPVTSQVSDCTPTGLLGMAGSVCEWTSKPAANPANPLGERLFVIIGGSYLKPGSNALTREWTASRSLRRPDLGFRLVFDPE
jgi:formylglycine-generating enzyme required for sulfatase activity